MQNIIFLIQSPSLHVLLPWDSNFRRMKKPHQPSQSPELLNRDKNWWLHILLSLQLFSRTLLPWNAPGSTCHCYMSPIAPASSLVPYWEKRRVIGSKCSLSRPWAPLLFISWEVGRRRPRSFPKQEDNTRKI